MNLTTGRIQQFVSALKKAGGSSGNKSLRETLGWDEEFYWRVQGQLISEGRLAAGRGKGGSVRLTEDDESDTAPAGSLPDAGIAPPAGARERHLYAPLKVSIEKWIKRFALDDVLVDETHSRGSKNTGGTFSRPDITAVGNRRYRFLPTQLEVITFEIKPRQSVSILGALESIAHREAAHRSSSSTQFHEASLMRRMIATGSWSSRRNLASA